MGNTWTFFISHYNVWLRSQKRIADGEKRRIKDNFGPEKDRECFKN